LIQDVGAPITGVRIHQEDEVGNVGEVIFAYEVPLHFQMEKLNSNLTAISVMETGQYFGLYFNKSVADCSVFNMRMEELQVALHTDDLKRAAIQEVAD